MVNIFLIFFLIRKICSFVEKYFFQTTLRRESFEVGILTPIPFVNVLFGPSIDFFTVISGNWFVWIWWLLFGVWTFGNFTDWVLTERLFVLYWLFLLITLFEATILLFPVTNAGFWFVFTAWERFLFFWVYISFYFEILA